MKFHFVSSPTLSVVMMMATSSTDKVHAQTAVGDSICVEGLVMDNFCIDRGEMLDPSGMDPFTDAEKHTVHCVADVEMCITSKFAILNDKGADGKYSVGYQTDDAGTALIVEAAKPVGVCTNGCTGDLVAGLRVGIKGTILDNTEPFTISAGEVTATNGVTNFCGGDAGGGADAPPAAPVGEDTTSSAVVLACSGAMSMMVLVAAALY